MKTKFPDWVHYLTQTGSGILIYGLAAAFIGGVIAIYFSKYADVWGAKRSEKKRKQTIEQLRADVKLLKPLRLDRDRLSILNALFIFVVLGLLAAGPIVGVELRYAPLIPNALALGLAFYWGRTLYRLNRFEEYEKEIEDRIRKLSGQIEPISVNQPVNLGTVSFTDNLFTDTLTVTPVCEPSKDWNITGGKWIPKENGLELVSVNPDSSPAYIWRTEPLPLPALIEFRTTFTGSIWQGLRVNLFADTPDETYASSNHIQLLIPWENGGYKMDYMNNGPLSITQTIAGIKPVAGQTYAYNLDINLERITVRIDGQIQFAADIRNNFQIRRHILRMPNAGWYWGFAAQGGLFEISDLKIANPSTR